MLDRALLTLCLLIAPAFSGAGCDSAPADAEPLKVGAAISLREVMQDLAALFERNTGAQLELVFGSSGQLRGQIESGAPIDVFISAAHQPVDQLQDAGLVDPASRRVVAGNALVLIVPADARDAAPGRFEDLAGPNVRRLAIGAPATVPAGQYAQQVLAKLGLAEALGDRIVHGTNVRQVLSYVERAEVSAGIVYRTDALESGPKVRIVAVADAGWHDPIEYPAAVVEASPRAAAASAFLEFLASPEARQALESRGFAVPAGR